MEGLRRLVNYIRQVEVAWGDGTIGYKPWMGRAKEKLAKSLSSKRDLAPGDVLGEEDLELHAPVRASAGINASASSAAAPFAPFPSTPSWPLKTSLDRHIRVTNC